jgi:geranylgeranyl diphosphate synthase, type II
MENLAEYTAYVEKHLQKIDLPTSPIRLYEPFRYFLAIGGKRIRPILTLLSAEMFGAPREKATAQALSVEIFHNFTLIHDDIMDAAPLRRNMSTVHEKWNTNIGILSGDVMLIEAYKMLSRIDPDKLPEALDLFNKTAIQVCEGQQLDMDFEEREDVSIHEYIEMIRLKTSVLLGSALRLGAIVAGASEQHKDAIYQFGEHIGVAFQIQDDILDLYADPDKFGKQVGGDILANKKTMLYLTAINKASKSQLEALRNLRQLDDKDLKISSTRELFDFLKVKDDCQTAMDHHYKLATRAIESIHVGESSKAPLIALAKMLMHREK